MSMRYQAGFLTASYFPLKVADAPTIGTASIASSSSVSVTFTAPSNVGGGAITSYQAVATDSSSGAQFIGTGASSPVTVSGLTTGNTYTVKVAAVNAFGAGPFSAASNSVVPVLLPGQQEYTTAGTYSWTAPAGITSVCVVCIGGGGGGNFSAGGTAGGDSYFISTATVKGGGGNISNGGAVSGGTYTGDGGGNGGGVPSTAVSGGGAGGYGGNGGNGVTYATDGTQGFGGGGGSGGVYNNASGTLGGGGGGVGIYGQGESGSASPQAGYGGMSGSGGVSGSSGRQGTTTGGAGGAFGGGGGGGYALGYGGCGGGLGYKNNITVVPGTSYTVVVGAGGTPQGNNGAGGVGAVRIIWGANRSFPSTNTWDL
jgi:hypothetical protein